MDDRNRPASAPAINQVVDQFESWRKTKKHREPIPAHLWKSAAILARDHPTSHIAKVLGLNYSDLKSRIEKLNRNHRAQNQKSALRFLEITPDPDGGASSRHTRPSRQCVVEMVNRFGDQMRINFSAGAKLDLPQLTRAFLGGRK